MIEPKDKKGYAQPRGGEHTPKGFALESQNYWHLSGADIQPEAL